MHFSAIQNAVLCFSSAELNKKKICSINNKKQCISRVTMRLIKINYLERLLLLLLMITLTFPFGGGVRHIKR